MRALATGSLVFSVLFAALVLLVAVVRPPGGDKPGRPEMAAQSQRAVPPVQGYAAGREVKFVHTEASDPEVAAMLTGMMGSPVLAVTALASTPEEALASVYVFANGLPGPGPFGYQADVFDRPPGDPGYSPLRRVNVVRWKQEGAARVLRSEDEIADAEGLGDISITRRDIVVNMPFLTLSDSEQ